MNFIGIDIGTSTISSVIYNSSSKETDYATIVNNSLQQTSPDWEKIQDPVKITDIIEEILSGYMEKYSDIKGIGITGQMHGVLYIDDRGNAISPLYTWQDSRGNLIYKDNKTYAEFLTDATGYKLATGYGLVTHFYNKVNNLVPPGAKKICTIMDYAVMKLSGKKEPVTDYTNGAGLGFFDVGNLMFDISAIEKVGIDASIVPDTDNSGSCLGYYYNIPVYPAIGDNQAAFIGSVEDKQSSVHITVGTSSQISVYTEKYIEIPELDTRPFPGGGYILVGAALCGGQAVSVLKDFFEKTLVMFGRERANIYDIMTSIDYKNNLQDIPTVKTFFNGTRKYPTERGSINNLSGNNFTPENLVIGFLKGVCRELYNFYNNLPEAIKKDKNNIIGSGNALKKNPLLRKAFEEQFELNIKFSHCGEEAAFGACMTSIK
jgi:sedoheptulokinase